jgi:hypothetical protein
MPPYEISIDRSRLDVKAIHAFLTQSFWSPGIPLATVTRVIFVLRRRVSGATSRFCAGGDG